MLRLAGAQGLTVSELVENVKPHGFDWGDNARGGKAAVSSILGQDNMFLRLAAGRFALRAIPGALRNAAAPARSRQELDVRTSFVYLMTVAYTHTLYCNVPTYPRKMSGF